jgi:hypothetical protein
MLTNAEVAAGGVLDVTVETILHDGVPCNSGGPCGEDCNSEDCQSPCRS